MVIKEYVIGCSEQDALTRWRLRRNVYRALEDAMMDISNPKRHYHSTDQVYEVIIGTISPAIEA